MEELQEIVRGSSKGMEELQKIGRGSTK